VTGASSGIGRAVAISCAAAGADIVVTYQQSADRADTVAGEIREHGVQASVLPLVLQNADSREEFVTQCTRTGPIHGLVNNAGVDLLTSSARDLDYLQKLQLLLAADVEGTVALSRSVAPVMNQQGRGSILNIGWDQSDRGMGGDSGELFATAKNAIMGFTRSLAVSLAPAVRVNCIAPGWIQTAWGESASDYWQQRVMDETPLKRWGIPEDIAHLARFLLSEEAGFMTGQVINVNGGAVR